MDDEQQYASRDTTPSQRSRVTYALEGPLMRPPTIQRRPDISLYSTQSEDIQLPITNTSAADYGSYDLDQQHHFDASQSSMESIGMQSPTHHAHSQEVHTSFQLDSTLPPMQQQIVQPSHENTMRHTRSLAEPVHVVSSHHPILPYPQQQSEGSGHRTTTYVTNETIADSVSYPMIHPLRTRLQSPFAESSPLFEFHDPLHTVKEEVVHSQTQLEQEKMQYTYQVQSACELIIAERVTEAKDKILAATRWLVASVVPLGLNYDDEQAYPQRLVMWTELNHCWEALGLKQKDITERALNHGLQPPDILTVESIHDLLDNIVGLCDQLEPLGLVDYELGLWEDQIVAVFEACLDLLTQY